MIEEFSLFNKQSFHRIIQGIRVLKHFKINPVATFEPEGIEVVDDGNVDKYTDTEGKLSLMLPLHPLKDPLQTRRMK